jgi:RNA polymerase sigma-70 factor (ECF subfamily)
MPEHRKPGAVGMHEAEFKNIYHESGRNLYNFILWITGNRSACDDILQDVFIKVWKCEVCPCDADERKRWLLAITRNTCLDFFRKSSRFSRFRTKYKEEWYEPPEDPDAPFLWSELQSLPEVERSILYLHLKNGHSYKEVADTLGLTENLVRVKAFRALRKLKETFVKKEL